MRIDHIAYRVTNKDSAADFFAKAFGYKIADKFEINFEDGTCAQCYAMVPPEKVSLDDSFSSWISTNHNGEYHIPPEIFISDGSPNSIVSNWVAKRGGTGAIHHIAYQVDDVEAAMSDWVERGLAKFTTDTPIHADGLTQCFTEENPITGVVYELINRTTKGFNISNVKDLMKSSSD